MPLAIQFAAMIGSHSNYAQAVAVNAQTQADEITAETVTPLAPSSCRLYGSGYDTAIYKNTDVPDNGGPNPFNLILNLDWQVNLLPDPEVKVYSHNRNGVNPPSVAICTITISNLDPTKYRECKNLLVQTYFAWASFPTTVNGIFVSNGTQYGAPNPPSQPNTLNQTVGVLMTLINTRGVLTVECPYG